MKMERQEARSFLAMLYGGEHHIPGKLKEFGEGWMVTTTAPAATFDGDLLTRLVVLAHRECVRVQVEPAGFYLRISLHKRQRTGATWERHPTLRGALERLGALELIADDAPAAGGPDQGDAMPDNSCMGLECDVLARGDA